MLISSTGTLVRTGVDEISIVGRNTQGVRLIRLAEGERLVGIERVDESFEGEGGESGEGAEAPAPGPEEGPPSA
jgi:DNA gyrase subunit A